MGVKMKEKGQGVRLFEKLAKFWTKRRKSTWGEILVEGKVGVQREDVRKRDSRNPSSQV